MLRVDGHTDNAAAGTGRFGDNWQLSSARAISVVKFLISRGSAWPTVWLPPAAASSSRSRPATISPEARATNRRIELKLTEKQILQRFGCRKIDTITARLKWFLCNKRLSDRAAKDIVSGKWRCR